MLDGRVVYGRLQAAGGRSFGFESSPALWGAAPPPSALAGPLQHPSPEHGIAQAKFLGHRSNRAASRRRTTRRRSLVCSGKTSGCAWSATF